MRELDLACSCVVGVAMVFNQLAVGFALREARRRCIGPSCGALPVIGGADAVAHVGAQTVDRVGQEW